MTDTPPAPAAEAKTPEAAPADKVAKPPKDLPTKERPRDAQGRELDEHGLPLIGPVRSAILAELELPDPVADPEAWRAAKPSKSEIEKASEAAIDALTAGDSE